GVSLLLSVHAVHGDPFRGYLPGYADRKRGIGVDHAARRSRVHLAGRRLCDLHHGRGRRSIRAYADIAPSARPTTLNRMWSEDRRYRILALLAAQGRVTANTLAEMLEVSRETVRRDVLQLEAEGRLRRVHGGVVAVEAAPEMPFAAR